MFHRPNTSSKKNFFKNLSSRVYSRCVAFWMLLRFQRLQRHHKIALLVTGISVSILSIVTLITGFYGDAVFGQVTFRIAILAVPECQNGIDDDGDELLDYPDDSDCMSSIDNSEGVPFVPIPVTVVCFPSATSVRVGESVIWTAIPANGNGVYTYEWAGTESLSGILFSVTKTYATPGIKTASITAIS